MGNSGLIQPFKSHHYVLTEQRRESKEITKNIAHSSASGTALVYNSRQAGLLADFCVCGGVGVGRVLETVP